MNIHAYLRDGEAFELAHMQALDTAYELVTLELPAGHRRLKELARQIIALALRGERDPILLCDKALARFGMLPPR
jgi:hypothetical protein